MAHKVKCKVCGITFDRDKEPAVKVDGRRYAHASCAEAAPPSQDEQDLTELHHYLQKLFGDNYSYVPLQRQIEGYVTKNGFSYSGILKSLVWWYEVQGNSLEKSEYRIGIVPYIYQDAYNYYFNLYKARQRNEGKDLKQYTTPSVVEVKIPPPKVEIPKFRLFNLDE